jgi:hypothetical protein
MERRSERREARDSEVVITVLGQTGAIPVPATLHDQSGKGVRILSPILLTPGAAVELDMGGDVFLGEVVYCQRAEAGSYAIGLKLEQVLADIRGLRNLLRGVWGDRTAPEASIRDILTHR